MATFLFLVIIGATALLLIANGVEQIAGVTRRGRLHQRTEDNGATPVETAAAP